MMNKDEIKSIRAVYGEIGRHSAAANCPSIEEIESIFNSGSKKSRLYVLSHPICPTHMLEGFAESECVQERGAVACNLSTPNAQLQRLLKDENLVVRSLAYYNPNTLTPAQRAIYKLLKLDTQFDECE